MIKKISISFFSFLIFAILSAHAGDQSLYQETYLWKDESDRDFSLSSLKGKNVIMAMAYTSCQGTCPLIISKLKKMEAEAIEKNAPVDIVVITFDPAFDIPHRTYAYYREKLGIKNSNWHFLTGSEAETRKLSMLLGVKYARNPQNGMIIHDMKFIKLNSLGIKQLE
jgi:protein SCO1/2